MADNFAPQIGFMLFAIAFIGVMLGMFYQDTAIISEEIGVLNSDGDFETGWTETGNNWLSLEDTELPIEFIIVFILPIVFIGGYIAFKTISGALPNWLSGG